MGGVDTLDSLLGLYRIRVRSKKYYHRIFYHVVDLAVVNSWLLYRRALQQKNSKDAPLALAEFKADIAEGMYISAYCTFYCTFCVEALRLNVHPDANPTYS
jgi:hypothetical protein